MAAAVSIPPVLRTTNADGSVHYSELKKLALSGAQYLQALNYPTRPTSQMLLGTLIHLLVLGPRPGARRLVRYDGATRQGNAWKEFAAANSDAEILTAPEWHEGEVIAEAIRTDPLAIARLADARLEVPLTWEENGIRFSTSGIDIVTADGAAGDLKTTTTVHPETWQRLAFRMLYPQQMAFYRRGLLANGIAVPRGLFVLGAETRPPFELVDLELTEGMIDFADRTVSLWIERLRVLQASIPEPRRPKDWPGYAQAPVPFDVPAWMRDDEDEDVDG